MTNETNNGKEMAFPLPQCGSGLTKREYIASQIMSGLCNMPDARGAYYSGQKPEETAKVALAYTDALLKALEKQS